MKASNYNYILYKDDFSYWMNGITRIFFRIPKTTGMKLERMLSSIEDIEKQVPSLYKRLVSGGFIINDNIDELQIIHNLQDATINTSDCMLVIIPTMNCNFSCWYCVQSHKPSLMTDKTMKKILNHINYKIKNDKITSLQVEWFGGEPFMQFKSIIEPLGAEIKKLCSNNNIPFTQSATTNGFFINHEVAQALNKYNFNHFQITLDGDREHHNKIKFQSGCESAFDYVLDNIANILDNCQNTEISLRINYDYSNIDPIIVQQVNEHIPQHLRHRLIVSPHKVWQVTANDDKTKSLSKIWHAFINAGYSYSNPLITDEYESCYVNRKNYITINYNGDVVKCTSDGNFGEMGLTKPGLLSANGSIEWKDDGYKLLSEPTGRTELCTDCKFLPLCFGPCPKQTINKKDKICKLTNSGSNFEDAIIEHINFILL